jgi:hypothetical protein
MTVRAQEPKVLESVVVVYAVDVIEVEDQILAAPLGDVAP